MWMWMPGVGLDYTDADNAVNTVTLVAALMLTIPFSVMGTFGNQFWDQLQQDLSVCNPPNDRYANVVYREVC